MSKLLAALLLSLSGVTAAIVHYAPPSYWGEAPSGPGLGSSGAGGGGHHFVAPEIDPSSAISALTLLVGGLIVVRGRFGKQSASV
jgi:hypothetical protein